MAVQRGLMRWNPNAAPIHGDVASSHLAGTTVDLERRRLTQEQIWWIEGYLLGMGDSVIVIEELREPCFHIMVLPELRDISGGISYEKQTYPDSADAACDSIGVGKEQH
jgi:hypothetical protein